MRQVQGVGILGLSSLDASAGIGLLWGSPTLGFNAWIPIGR